MSTAVHVDLPECPYPGIEPFRYTHHDVFFAREAEIRSLTHRVLLHRGVLLYAASGIGKSSLVNAGLLPAARSEELTPERIRVQPQLGQEIVVERIEESERDRRTSLPSMFARGEAGERVVLGTEEFLTEVREHAETMLPLLIFDQFEEWVTLFEETFTDREDRRQRLEAQENVRQMLVSLLHDHDAPVKVLIVFREDYLANLAPLFRQCPELPDHYVRLEPLTEEEVYRAIRGPYERFPEFYGDTIPEPLAVRIRDDFAAGTDSGYIQLSEVQIVCRTLFEAAGPGRQVVEAYDDPTTGGVKGILQSYFAGRLASLAEDEREPAVALLSKLLTPAGTRNVVAEDSLLQWVELEEAIPRERLQRALRGLETKSRLVRREPRRQVYYYEIASEFLVEWIRTMAQERHGEVEKRKLLDQLKQEQRARRQRRWRIALTVWSTVGVLAFVLLGFALKARSTAEQLRWDALAHALAAEAMGQRHEHGALLARQAFQFSERGSGWQAVGHLDEPLRAALRWPYFSDELKGHRDVIWSVSAGAVAIGKATAVLASTSRDGTVRLWDLAERAEIGPPLYTSGPGVVGLAFDGQGRRLAGGTTAGTVLLWDMPGRQRRVLVGPQSAVVSVAFSPDSALLAVGHANGQLRLWNVNQGSPVDSVDTHRAAVWTVSFSPDGALLASADFDNRTLVWEISAMAKSPTELRGMSAAFSPSGSWLATGGEDGLVRVWRSDRLAAAPDTLWNGETDVVAVAFHRDGRTLAFGGEDGVVRVRDVVEHGTDPVELTGHDSWVYTLSYAPDGKSLASAGADRKIIVWTGGAGTSVTHMDTTLIGERVDLLRLHRDNGMLAIVTSERAAERQSATASFSDVLAGGGKLRLTTPSDGVDLTVTEPVMHGVVAVGLSPDGSLVAVGDTAGMLTLRRTDGSPGPAPRRAHKGAVRALAFDGAGTLLASGGADSVAQLWRLDASGDVDSLTASFRHNGAVLTVALSPDGELLASGGTNRKVRLWRPAAVEPVLLASPGHETVRAVEFSPSGALLASASDDGKVRVWRTAELGKSPILFEGHEDWVQAIAFSADERYLASAGDDETIRIWDLQQPSLTPTVLRGHAGPVRGVVFRGGDRWLTSGGEDGTVRSWVVGADTLAQMVCARMQRNLRLDEWRSHVGPDLEYDRTCAELPVHPSVIVAARKEAADGNSADAKRLFQRVVVLDPELELDPQAEHDRYQALGDLRRLVEESRERHGMQAGTGDSSIAADAVRRDLRRLRRVHGRLASLERDGTDQAVVAWREIMEWGVELVQWRGAALAAEAFAVAGVLGTDSVVGEALVARGRQVAFSGDGPLGRELLRHGGELMSGIAIAPDSLVVGYESLGELTRALLEAWRAADGLGGLSQPQLDTGIARLAEARRLGRALQSELPPVREQLVDAQPLLGWGQDLAQAGHVQAALDAYGVVAVLVPEDSIPAWRWNNLCWFASTWRQAHLDEVWAACERAVALDSTDTGVRDTRGLARALRGDTAGAIADFQAFADDPEHSNEERAERRRWIRALRAGGNPFADDVLMRLRG